MNAVATVSLLFVAACLEVGGDALVRLGLKDHSGSVRLALIALGGLVLAAYGVFVNVAPADFGRLLGIYVVLFFIVAQLFNLFLFGIRPGMPIVAGGALIVCGGLLITVWKTWTNRHAMPLCEDDFSNLERVVSVRRLTSSVRRRAP